MKTKTTTALATALLLAGCSVTRNHTEAAFKAPSWVVPPGTVSQEPPPEAAARTVRVQPVFPAGLFPTNTTYPTNLPVLVIDTNKLYIGITQTRATFTVTCYHLTNGVVYYVTFKHHASDGGWRFMNFADSAAPSTTLSKAGLYAAGFSDSMFFNVQNTTNGIIFQ